MKVPCFDCSCRDHGCSFINYGVCVLLKQYLDWLENKGKNIQQLEFDFD